MLNTDKEITEPMDNVLSGPVKPNYIPFGDDWEKEMLKFSNIGLVDLIRKSYKERNALKAQQINMSEIYMHVPSGITGFYINEYKPTGKPLTMQIKLLCDKVYYAPKDEFVVITDVKHNR